MWEFERAMQGYHRRIETNRAMLAWHACNVMAPHVKKSQRLSPKDLLGGQTTLPKAKRKKRKRKKRKREEA